MLLTDSNTLTQMSIFLWMQAKCDARLDFWFWYKCSLTKMQMQFFMMQMFHAGMKMQSLFMMIPVHAFRPWCKCLLTEMEMQMSSNGYVMMQMFLCRNAMMQMLWRKHNLFKFPLFSNRGFPSAWNQNIFKTWLIIPQKSSSFWLKAPKKIWWSLLENLWMGHWLGIWWSGSKDLFSQFG